MSEKNNENIIYYNIVQSIVICGSEIWELKSRTLEVLKATEMDFWRRSAGISRRDHIKNEREILSVALHRP